MNYPFAIMIAFVWIALAAMAVVYLRWKCARRLPKYDQRRRIMPLNRKPARFVRVIEERRPELRARLAEEAACAAHAIAGIRIENEGALPEPIRKRMALRRRAFAVVIQDRYITGLPLV
jgi:hypothetical protein